MGSRDDVDAVGEKTSRASIGSSISDLSGDKSKSLGNLGSTLTQPAHEYNQYLLINHYTVVGDWQILKELSAHHDRENRLPKLKLTLNLEDQQPQAQQSHTQSTSPSIARETLIPQVEKKTEVGEVGEIAEIKHEKTTPSELTGIPNAVETGENPVQPLIQTPVKNPEQNLEQNPDENSLISSVLPEKQRNSEAQSIARESKLIDSKPIDSATAEVVLLTDSSNKAHNDILFWASFGTSTIGEVAGEQAQNPVREHAELLHSLEQVRLDKIGKAAKVADEMQAASREAKSELDKLKAQPQHTAKPS